jgi:hypothetical protein
LVLATVQHKAVPAAPHRKAVPSTTSSFGWSPLQKIAFVVFILFGVPLLRVMFNSPGRPAKAPGEQARPALAPVRSGGSHAQPAGSTGVYRDPMNRYFEVEPPAGWQIIEKRDKGTFTFGPDSPHPGRVAPRSWIVFRKDRAEIGVIGRPSYSTIERDFDLVLNGYRERFSGMIEKSGFITVDGAKGGELEGSIRGTHIQLVKYKKNGLDHAITMTCPAGETRKFLPAFQQFVKSYRSLGAGTASAPTSEK